MVRQPIVSQGLVIIEASRSYSNTPHSVGLLWTIDQPDADRPLPDKTKHSQETDIHSYAGIRTRNPSNERPEAHALNRAAIGIDNKSVYTSIL